MTIQRGEVYFVNLDPAVGREQKGRRPAIVVSSDALNQQPLVVVAVPGTRTVQVGRRYPWNVNIPAGEGGLSFPTTFMAFQIRALDPSRFSQAPLGVMSAPYLAALEKAIIWTLDLPDPPTP
jgi:mRNA interferase MazF